MLSAGDIAWMQAILLGAMDMSLTIDRPSNGVTAWATTTESFTTIASGVRCLINEPTQPVLNATAPGPISVQQLWEIWTPQGTDVQVNDRVTLSTGLILRVHSIGEPRAEYYLLDGFLASAST